MEKRAWAIFSMLFFLMMPPVSAQQVTVDGMGMDRASALNDAKRNAVEQVIGTYIDSRTLVRDAMVALDEIYARSYGFVKNVELLEEIREGDSYRIKARVDVDTSPDSELLDQLSLIESLNDPRVSAVVSYGGKHGNEDMAAYCESAIVTMLLGQGFHYVIDPDVVRNDSSSGKSSVDYLVTGQLHGDAAEILLPKYADYTNENSEAPSVHTGLSKAVASLDAKIVKTDTQEVIGEFRVTGESIRDSNGNAERLAIQNLAAKAAETVRKTFARHGAKVNGNVQVIARTDDQGNLVRLESLLSALPGVHQVTLRSYEGGKGTFYVDADLKPGQIFRLLKEKDAGIFMEKSSAHVLEISI